MQARVVGVTGPLSGTIVELTDGDVSLGRAQTNTVVVHDPRVLLRHLVIRRDGPDFRLENLAAPERTRVNDAPFRIHLLADGDRVTVGASVLAFHAGATAARVGDTPSMTARTADAGAGGTATAAEDGASGMPPLEHDLIGENLEMRGVYRLIGRVARTDASVLISGESGTGKELVARAIHRNSPRARKPFIALNCAALPESLLESELFGHERGAFTGAVLRKVGKIERADGGTLFLDEVGELPRDLQVKLLRALQERNFERVGGTETVEVDIRLLAATNRDLEEATRTGAFRVDLYYRLHVVAVTLPALRDRREDVPLLANHFAGLASAKLRRGTPGFTEEALELLRRYHWPGNVRELSNVIERALVLGAEEVIRAEDLPETLIEAVSDAGTPLRSYHEAIDRAKRKVILAALERASGSVKEAGKLLGLNRSYLHRLMRNLRMRGWR